jgi:predicted PurR-regulated permease PerM
MKKGVNLPPAFTLGIQALMSLLFGFLGLIVAVPLLAAIMTVVRTLSADEMREISAEANATVGDTLGNAAVN